MRLGIKIVCSIILVAILMGGLGLLFGTLIDNAIANKYADYTSAIRAETPEEFANAIANKNNVIAKDKFVADEVVSHEQLDGEYAYIRVDHRQKIMKTRVVTKTVNGKTQSHTEIYKNRGRKPTNLLVG